MDEARRAWSILTKSRGGTVSVIRDLTLAECRQMYERLDPWYGYSVAGDGEVVMRHCQESDIEIREVFGPEDWDRSEMSTWQSWPK